MASRLRTALAAARETVARAEALRPATGLLALGPRWDAPGASDLARIDDIAARAGGRAVVLTGSQAAAMFLRPGAATEHLPPARDTAGQGHAARRLALACAKWRIGRMVALDPESRAFYAVLCARDPALPPLKD